jgi:drug/metabolite transporter (DMT)-like permease
MLLIMLLHSLYGCTFTISKILVCLANPIFVIGIRMLIAGILLFTYTIIFKNKKNLFSTIDKKTLLYLIQIAVIGTFFPYVLRYWATQFLPVTKTALLYSFSPLFSFFFSYFFLSEKATIRKWLGLIIGFCGIFPLLIAKSIPTEQATDPIGFFSFPELAMIIAVICYCYGWAIMKKLILHNTLSPTQINGFNMFIAGILALITTLFIEPNQHIQLSIQFIFWLTLIIIITNIIYCRLYIKLLKKHSVTLLSLAGLISPISAAITSWIYFGEKITWDSFATGIFVLIGFGIFYSEELSTD